MRFLILFIFLVTNVVAKELPGIKNIVIHKDQKTAAVVNLAEKKKKKLDELSLHDLKKIEPKLNSDVLKVFDLKNSVNSKKSYGGTSFDNIKKRIIKYKKQK